MMDISGGDDDLAPNFLAPIPLPEVGVGSAEEVADQKGNNDVTDNVDTVLKEIAGDNVPTFRDQVLVSTFQEHSLDDHPTTKSPV